MDKMKTGAYDAAYKLYSKAVIFPEIVSRICPAPCEKACFRKETDSAVAISWLEKACCQLSSKKSASFFISDKKKRILIVGGGLTGLGAAVRLSSRGYHVHLTEQNSHLGGRLWDISEEILPHSILMDEISKTASGKFLTIETGRHVDCLDDFEFDAALVATGAGGDDLGAGSRADVFTAGSLEDPSCSPIESLYRGMGMSLILDAFIQSAKPLEKPRIPSRYHPDTSRWEIRPSAVPSSSEEYPEEAVQEEAGRCMGCTCNACMEVCESLPYFYNNPVTAILDINGTANKTEFTTKKAQRFINSCTLCGLCGKVCSYGIDFKEICLETKRFMQKNNDMPPVYHEFWINDMLYSNSEESRLVKLPKGRTTARYAFFPGCQMAGSDPAYVTGTYRLLSGILDGGVAVMQMCCGIPAHWAGLEDEHNRVLEQIRNAVEELGSPTLILACPSCMSAFQDHLPDISICSLWDILKPEHFPDRKSKHKKVSVFDPCSSRYTQEIQQNIRRLVNQLGYETEELSYPGEEAKCCGYGGHIYNAVEDVYKRSVNSAASLSDNQYVTYCVNCRDCFASQGKEASHILDHILFEDEARERRPEPSISLRRSNRLKTKQLLLKEFWDMEFEKQLKAHDALKIHYSEEVADKLNRLLILEDNIKKTILYGLDSGHIIYNCLDHSLTCHLQQGFQTYYVQFTENEDGSYTVQNAYKHRMSIVELVDDV